MANILAFESFDSGSHQQFRETVTRHSSHQWTWITRPARGWKWRMTIGAQELVDDAIRKGCFHEKPDRIFATSLLDVAALRAALPKGFRDIPITLYMHENQIAYPSDEPRDAFFALTNLQSILTADDVIFNSKWNLDSFISGIESLLQHAPDSTLGNVGNRVRSRSTVAWVPVELPPEDLKILHNTNNKGPTTIVWPHRWEHDKRPDLLLELARKHQDDVELRWIILGEQFNEVPEALQTFKKEFADDIDHMGFVESKEEYWHWLAKGDWVLSTADHEFFGIAVVEALFSGCMPWLPERLSYRELLPTIARTLTPPLACTLTPPQAPPQERTLTPSWGDVHEAIMDHLFMAQAPNAVKRIDSLLGSCLGSDPLVPDPSGSDPHVPDPTGSDSQKLRKIPF